MRGREKRLVLRGHRKEGADNPNMHSVGPLISVASSREAMRDAKCE